MDYQPFYCGHCGQWHWGTIFCMNIEREDVVEGDKTALLKEWRENEA